MIALRFFMDKNPARSSSFRFLEPLPAPALYFNTGPLPYVGTVRRLSEWWNIDVSPRGERGRLSYEKAQKELHKLLHKEGACHEHIAFEAVKLVDDKEVEEHALHIVTGAMAEDWVFLPGESLQDLYVERPRRKYKAGEMVPPEEMEPRSLIKGVFDLIARLWRKITFDVRDDAINRPYMAHFYDPTRKKGDRGLNVLNGEIRFESALHRAKRYWNTAVNFYIAGRKAQAYVALGHLLHLIADMHVPAHVHNDIHGPTILLGKLDSLEQWLQKKDWEDIRRPRDAMNIKIWGSEPLRPPEPMDWSLDPEEHLEAFINDIVSFTQRFRSVDAEGFDPDQRKKGKLTDEECYRQAEILIPRAIYNSAQIIVNFKAYISTL